MEVERIDLAALGIEAKSWSGTDNAICICVFHSETNASMSVNVVKGLYQCFSCGSKGSVNKIAKKTGGTVSKVLETVKPKPAVDDWDFLIKAPLALDDFYLKSRGVTNTQVTKFEIKNLKNGIGFPLKDEFGDLCGVLVRRKETNAKPRYQLFGSFPPVWPMENLARNVYVTEGIFGVLSADRAGVKAVATLSASIRKESVFALLPSRLYVIFDNDFAGYLGSAKLRVSNPECHVLTKPGLEADKMGINDWLEIDEGVRKDDILFTNTTHELAIKSGDEAALYEGVANFLEKLKGWLNEK